MFTVIENERHVHVKIKNRISSNRWCIFDSYEFDERSIFVSNYGQVTERTAFPKFLSVYSTKRSLLIPSIFSTTIGNGISCIWSSASDNERLCMYIQDAMETIASFTIIFPFTYSDEITCYWEDSTQTQRTCLFAYEQGNERKCWIEIFKFYTLRNSDISLKIGNSTERQSFFQDETKLTDERNIMIVVEGFTERECSYIDFTESVVKPNKIRMMLNHSTQVQSIFDSVLFDERYVELRGIKKSTERSIYFQVQNEVVSSRKGYFARMEAYSVHEWKLIPGTPTPTERYVSYEWIIHNTEREVFVETRDLKDIDIAYFKEPTTVLVSRLDTNRNTEISIVKQPDDVTIEDEGTIDKVFIAYNKYNIDTKFDNFTNIKKLGVFSTQGTLYTKGTERKLNKKYSGTFSLDLKINIESTAYSTRHNHSSDEADSL